MKKLPIDRQDLILAFEDHSPEVSYYLDLTTGEILRISEYDDEAEKEKLLEKLLEKLDEEPGRYKPIEQLSSHESYRFMEDFIETIHNQKLQRELQNAIKGRGAFRRFKDTLTNYPDERERWFKFPKESYWRKSKAGLKAWELYVKRERARPGSLLAFYPQSHYTLPVER